MHGYDLFNLIHLENHPRLSFVLKKHSVDASAFRRHSQCFEAFDFVITVLKRFVVKGCVQRKQRQTMNVRKTGQFRAVGRFDAVADASRHSVSRGRIDSQEEYSLDDYFAEDFVVFRPFVFGDVEYEAINVDTFISSKQRLEHPSLRVELVARHLPLRVKLRWTRSPLCSF
jgi:hypothetical protein